MQTIVREVYTILLNTKMNKSAKQYLISKLGDI